MEKNSNIRTVGFFVVFTVFLVMLIAIFWPFYRPIAASAVFAVLIFPFFKFLRERTKSRTLSAALCVITLVFAVLIPLVFTAFQLFKEVDDAARTLQYLISQDKLGQTIDRITQHRYFLKLMPLVKEQMLLFEADIFRSAYQILEDTARYMASNSFIIARNVLWFTLEIFIVLVTVFFMLRDSDKIINTLKDLSPFRKEETSKLFTRIKNTVHASVFGSIVVSLIQGVMGALGFYVLGLPSPVLWGVVMAIIGIIPVIGPSTIWLPAAIILMINGHVFKGVLLIIWGAFFMGLVENVMRPVFIGKGAQFHPVLIFFSIFGAIMLMGPIGLFMGPIILSLTLTTADFLKERYND